MMNGTIKKTITGLAVLTLAVSAFTGCENNNDTPTAENQSYKVSEESDAKSGSTEKADKGTDKSISANTEKLSYSGGAPIITDTASLFSERDLEQTADTSEAKKLTVSDGKTLDITEAGVYIISGSAKNCTVKVDADKDAKVQLVLDGVEIENDDFPAIYVLSADKVFVTSAGSDNTLAVNDSFRADGDTDTDAVIFSKDDLVLNGTGTLTVYSAYANGISCKDDLKITGGTYDVTASQDAFEANDSISVSGGDFIITTNKDGFHCENDEDDSLGSIYIADGSFGINAGSDGIQATTFIQIDGGTFDLTSAEGLEATYIQINDGKINISASDDGINASEKSTACDIIVEFNGGSTTITVGQGDTDGVDANGSIYVNGGTIDVTAQMSSFDYDQTAEFNGGTIIVNGEEVSEIPQSMMGGPGGGRGGFSGGPGSGHGSSRGFGMPDDFGGSGDPWYNNG